jgi:hypothetical protein
LGPPDVATEPHDAAGGTKMIEHQFGYYEGGSKEIK